jgi:hypothetical protein
MSTGGEWPSDQIADRGIAGSPSYVLRLIDLDRRHVDVADAFEGEGLA